MSLRKFMHPRNKYKKVPNFKELALLYPEFRNIAIVDLGGKIKIDFKNEESLRVLTEVLLKHDFNLDVKIPPSKLVPTLPLRLNYILWIEDLMKHASFTEMEEVVGVDIGTGAVCIYPLLFAKMYGNKMIGTDVDETSVQTAVAQIENNNLQRLLKVLKVDKGVILKGVTNESEEYHFTMCNPPFFDVEPIEGSSEEVTKRSPPRNAPTGNKAELKVEGGERAFVTQMIDESMEIKERIKIYTTMFGRKSNLLFLLKLMKRKCIENMTWTEFCQGYTKRWGLAWSFLPKDIVDLTSAPVIRKSGDYIAKLLKEQRPSEIQFPIRRKFSSFDNLVNFLQEAMQELNVRLKELNLPIDDFHGWSSQLIAEKDTWSHARRKRRLAQRLTTDRSKDRDAEDSVAEEGKIPASPEQPVAKEPLLICNIFAEVIEHEECEDDDVKISMVFEKGTGGRNALETFRQYLINKLDVREYFQKRRAKGSSKKERKRLKAVDSERNLEETESLPNTESVEVSVKD